MTSQVIRSARASARRGDRLDGRVQLTTVQKQGIRAVDRRSAAATPRPRIPTLPRTQPSGTPTNLIGSQAKHQPPRLASRTGESPSTRAHPKLRWIFGDYYRNPREGPRRRCSSSLLVTLHIRFGRIAGWGTGEAEPALGLKRLRGEAPQLARGVGRHQPHEITQLRRNGGGGEFFTPGPVLAIFVNEWSASVPSPPGCVLLNNHKGSVFGDQATPLGHHTSALRRCGTTLTGTAVASS
jgi:hypothetical protein